MGNPIHLSYGFDKIADKFVIHKNQLVVDQSSCQGKAKS